MNSPQSSPQSKWPGWLRDQDLADRFARELRKRLGDAFDIEQLIRDWDMVNSIPQRISPGDAESFLMANGQAARLQDALAQTLDDLWREAWELGVLSALEVSGDVKHPSYGVIKSDPEDGLVICDMGHEHTGHNAAGLLIRHDPLDDKRRWLLQKRGDAIADGGTWEIFGGGLHKGEDNYSGAWREAEEEAGKLPGNLTLSHKVVDDHGGWSYTTYIMDSPDIFHPSLDGKTPFEVAGCGWFTKKEIKKLPLHDAFADRWDTIRHSTHDTAINSALHKGWKSPFAGSEAAPLPDDPWRDVRDQLQEAGIPDLVSGPLASAFLTWESYQGATGVIGMVSTLVGKLSQVLLRRREGEITPDEAVAEIRDILDDEAHALRIALTETTKAVNNAAQETYINTNDIEYVLWVTAHDTRVCVVCQGNADAGPIPIEKPFPSGIMLPPQHPNCRCVVIPAKMPPGATSAVDDWAALGASTHNKSAETPYLSSHHAPIGHEGLWHSKHPPLQLPAYIQNIRNALMRNGMGEREAHAMAVAAVERWARGDLKWGPHRHVTPEVQHASAEAVRQWEQLRANHP